MSITQIAMIVATRLLHSRTIVTEEDLELTLASIREIVKRQLGL